MKDYKLIIAGQIKGAGSDCIIFIGTKQSRQYGVFANGGKARGVLTKSGYTTKALAHRTAYEIVNGPIPDGHMVRHSCDNPPCINPNHLVAGTAMDNARDRQVRRRHNLPRGERAHQAKLNNDQIMIIRARFSKGETQSKLAREFGISVASMHDIVHCKSYKDA